MLAFIVSTVVAFTIFPVMLFSYTCIVILTLSYHVKSFKSFVIEIFPITKFFLKVYLKIIKLTYICVKKYAKLSLK